MAWHSYNPDRDLNGNYIPSPSPFASMDDIRMVGETANYHEMARAIAFDCLVRKYRAKRQLAEKRLRRVRIMAGRRK
jgi:hypothetical protein